MSNLKKCCICQEVITIGYELPNGDCVCADYTCCFQYCASEGKRFEQEVKEVSE